MLSISPSQVRARILAEHAAIHARLDRVAEVAAALKANNSVSIGEVISHAQELYHALLEHLSFEDLLLDGTLRTIDAWGTIRAERLAVHHAEQRDQLRELIERTVKATPDELAALLSAVVAELRADMQAEEQDILSPQLLRDDVIAIDSEGG